MSAGTSSPLSPPSPGPSTDEEPELERNPSPSSKSAVGIFSNAQNAFVTGGYFQVQNSEQKHSESSPGGFFTNARNVTISGSNFITIDNAHHTDTGKVQKEMFRKPSPSPLFIGRKDVLDKLKKIFVPGSDGNLPPRHSCLLWGAEETGKTQICLKFTQEISDRMSHVFWVDASSLESIIESLKGLSGIPAKNAGSAESALRWISRIQKDWLIVFDNAGDLPPDVVARFFPPGNRGNILITSRNQSMGRFIASENVIEIRNEPDAVV